MLLIWAWLSLRRMPAWKRVDWATRYAWGLPSSQGAASFWSTLPWQVTHGARQVARPVRSAPGPARPARAAGAAAAAAALHGSAFR
jgi:hypothetical protein